MTTQKIIQELDLIDIVGLIDKKKRKFQAIMLQEIEEVLNPESEEFAKVRKSVLDWSNNYTRSIMRAIFDTDFEGVMK